MSGGGDSLHLEAEGAGRPGRLRDRLFERGVEFPCGGALGCGGCRVRVIAGSVPITPGMRAVLTEAELAAGWRLGCEAEQGDGPLTLEVEQWLPTILEDRAALSFEPAEGLGAVVDVGTTTLVVQVVDRASGRVIGVETALNPQAAFGADLMSRVAHERQAPGQLTDFVREAVGRMLAGLARGRRIEDCLLVGNTVMHHLFGGLDLEPLASAPFRSPTLDAVHRTANELGWTEVELGSPACFVPCLGGFVGSDVLSGIVATGLHEADEPGALLDLGTNGEIAVGNRREILVASTAAGPAFEGGRIGQGIRAGTGAIDRVERSEAAGGLTCHVIGGGPPRGICGSGLVDAVACLLDLDQIAASGRLAGGPKTRVALAGTVALDQSDIRELQLAKAALAAGFELLLAGRRLTAANVRLAGAFGNYIRAESAVRIGLLPEWAAGATPAGNAALRGARLLLLSPSRREAIVEAVRSRCRHVELASDPAFQDTFVDSMPFPERPNIS